MANKKISQLTDGTSFQPGDEAVVNRSGANFKVDPTVGVVQQADIGTDPNQVPLNQYLGSMAYQDLENVVVGELTADGLAVDTDTLYVDAANNRVGIGTSSPTALLHLSSSGASTVINITDSSGYGAISNSSGSLYLTADRGDVGSKFMSFRVGGTTERMRLDASGNLLVGTTTSPSDTGTVVADGIYLGGTGAANLLDDYEEGTFTPTMVTGTVDHDYATYIKIGNQVTITVGLENFSDSSSANAIQMTGLPFTPQTGGEVFVRPTGICYGERLDVSLVVAVVENENNQIGFYNGVGSANFSPISHSQINDGVDAAVRFTLTYQTNS